MLGVSPHGFAVLYEQASGAAGLTRQRCIIISIPGGAFAPVVARVYQNALAAETASGGGKREGGRQPRRYFSCQDRRAATHLIRFGWTAQPHVEELFSELGQSRDFYQKYASLLARRAQPRSNGLRAKQKLGLRIPQASSGDASRWPSTEPNPHTRSYSARRLLKDMERCCAR